MTRELKLALIVGFLLVMVVTVLLSDHYSKSRQSDLAADTPARPTLVPDLSPEVEEPETALAIGDGGPIGPDMPLTGGPQNSSNTQQPVRMADGSIAGNDGLGQVPEGGNTAVPNGDPVVFNQGRDDQNRLLAEAVARATRRLSGEDGSMPEALKREFVNGTPGPSGTPVPNETETKLAEETQLPEPAAERIHTVVAGDTLTKVARKYYNDGNAWKQLAAYNSGVIGKDAQVRIGAKLRIPSPEVLAGKTPAARPVVREPAPLVVADKTKKPVAERPEVKPLPKDAVNADKSKVAKNDPTKIQLPPKSPSKAKAPTYTVRKGDTLREIARTQLGSVARADEIIQLNPKLIKDPNNVPAGAVLTLPNKA